MDYLYYPEASQTSTARNSNSGPIDPTATVLDFRGLGIGVARRQNQHESQIAAFGSTVCHYDNNDDGGRKTTIKQRDEIIADQQFHVFLAVAVVCLLIIVLLVVGLVTTATRSA